MASHCVTLSLVTLRTQTHFRLLMPEIRPRSREGYRQANLGVTQVLEVLTKAISRITRTQKRGIDRDLQRITFVLTIT